MGVIDIIAELFRDKLFASPVLAGVFLILVMLVLLSESSAPKYIVAAFMLLLVAPLSEAGYLPAYIYPSILVAIGVIWGLVLLAATRA